MSNFSIFNIFVPSKFVKKFVETPEQNPEVKDNPYPDIPNKNLVNVSILFNVILHRIKFSAKKIGLFRNKTVDGKTVTEEIGNLENLIFDETENSPLNVDKITIDDKIYLKIGVDNNFRLIEFISAPDIPIDIRWDEDAEAFELIRKMTFTKNISKDDWENSKVQINHNLNTHNIDIKTYLTGDELEEGQKEMSIPVHVVYETPSPNTIIFHSVVDRDINVQINIL